MFRCKPVSKQLKTISVFALLMALAVMCCATDLSHGDAAIEQRFIRFANDLPYFNCSEVLYGRGLYDDPRTSDYIGPYPEFLKLTKTADTRLLTRLLKHRSPRVRTLALAALFTQQEHKSVLLGAAGLFKDESKTYPSVVWNLNARVLSGDELPPAHTTDQTVAVVASKLYDWYGRHSTGQRNSIRFDDYWAAHKDRTVCAGWLAIEYDFAFGGSTAVSPYEAERGIRLRQRLASLKDADRDLTIAWIATNRDFYGHRFMDDQKLLEVYRRLGHATIVQILRGMPPTTDPDLKIGYPTSTRYKSMMRFILEYADVLLNPDDAGLLLDLHKLSHGRPTSGTYPAEYIPPQLAGWSAVAAQFSGTAGLAELKAAIRDFDKSSSSQDWEQARLVATLWRQAERKELKYVLEWFYQSIDVSTGYPDTRSEFLMNVLADPRPVDSLLLLKEIALDPRLDQLPANSLRTLIEAVNDISGRPIVASDEMRHLYHPLGISHYFLYKQLVHNPRRNQTESETAGFRRRLAAHSRANEQTEATVASWREFLIDWANNVD